MRGRVCEAWAPVRTHGITPAYAGKRHIAVLYPLNHQDHPRVCGEEQTLLRTAQKSLGSPPRMRGRVIPEDLKNANLGITPAYAGKRGMVRRNSWNSQDHPRVCGEERYRLRRFLRPPGSPPRMRGRVYLRPPFRAACRITPAYAGKRRINQFFNLHQGDHPRVCGEEVLSTST